MIHHSVGLDKDVDTKGTKIQALLRELSKKGFLPIMKYIREKGDAHYNDTLRYAKKHGIAGSHSTVTITLNTLTDLGLLERIVSRTRPLRTSYRLTKKGSLVLDYVERIERVMDESES